MRTPTMIAVSIIVVAGLAADDKTMTNTLTAKEKADGWRLLFDGRTTAGWRGFRQQQMPAGWRVVDGALTRVAAATDIVTNDEFGDFELTVDWNLASNGNSGIFYRVTEDDDVMWHTAPTTISIRRRVTRRGRSARGTRRGWWSAVRTSNTG